MNIDFDSLFSGDSIDTLTDPRKLFSVLPNKASKYSYLRDVQSDVLDAWSERRDEKDLVIKMNTGGGKTVLGLLILKTCLNDKKGPAVYVCPDNFLVGQVTAEARSLGIQTTEDSKSIQFRKGEAILVIPIHTLFNGMSVFGVTVEGSKIRIGSIIIDDAHACLATAESQFTLKLPSTNRAFTQLLQIFTGDIENQSPTGLLDISNGDARRLMLVPYWSWIDKLQQVIGCLHPFRETDDFKFVWPLIEDTLQLCQCVFTGASVEISSRCLPVDAIPSFSDAKRRLYMTATLANDTILITDFNADAASIKRPITPKNASDLGDRMIITPQELNPGITDDQIKAFAKECSKEFNVVVIVPSDHRAKYWNDVADAFLNSKNLREGIERLKVNGRGLTILSNKYDGIDLPYDACRLLILDGIPEVRRLIDRYEQAVLNDGDDILTRQMQKVEQGMGRGVRANDDYCVVFLMGTKLTQSLFSREFSSSFSPATAAQLNLSESLSKQIRGQAINELRPVISYCLLRNSQWLRASRQALVNVAYNQDSFVDDDAIKQREAYTYARSNQYQKAAEITQQVANSTAVPKIGGWIKQQLAEYTHHFDRAKAQEIQLAACTLNRSLLKPLEGIAYQKLGIGAINQALQAHSFLQSRFKSTNEIIIWIHGLAEDLEFYQDEYKRFEKAFAALGTLIGFQTQRPENETGRGPDVLWSLGNLKFLVIEAKNGAVTDFISKSDVDQLTGSMVWFGTTYDSSCNATPVIIHPSTIIGPHGSPREDMLVIDGEGLAKIRRELVQLAKDIGGSVGMPDAERLRRALEQSSFGPTKFISTFAKRYRNRV